MTDKIDTSPEAVRLHSPYHDGSMVLDNDGGWVSIDDYRALSARVAELEERYLAVVGDKINLRGEVATLKEKLAKADAWQEAVFAAHPNIDLDIETKENGT